MTPEEIAIEDRIRKNLTDALKKSGDYFPEIDDLLIDRIAKTEIRLKKIDSIADSNSTITTYTRIVDMETKLDKIIQNATHQLAISRRDRLANRAQANFVVELKEALLEAIKNGEQSNHQDLRRTIP